MQKLLLICASVKDILQKNGINVIVENKVVEFLGTERVESVKLMDGNVLDADIAIVATGVRPNLDIVKDNGIEVLSGIIINEYLETNMPDVYAAEGITEAFVAPELEKKLVFLWSNAIIQGTIAGYNIVCRKTKYTSSNLQTIIKVFGTPVVADGIYDEEELKLFENGVYKKMFIKDSKIIGYMLINTIEKCWYVSFSSCKSKRYLAI